MKLNIFLFYFLFLGTIQNVISQTINSSNDSLIIVQQLYSLNGNEYVVNQTINIDSVESNFSWEYRNINDPYNQLANCIIFTASEKLANYQYANSIVGILQNSQIIWKSNLIQPLSLSFGRILATADFTNNNKTEILTEWVENDKFGAKNLWIFSWDGSTSELITQTLSGQSTIVTHGYSQFDFIDIEGDGIWEIISFYRNTDNSFSPNIYKWDGNNYSYSETAQIGTVDMFFPRNNVSATIVANTSKTDNSETNFNYFYSVTNNASSSQQINVINIEGGMDTVLNVTYADGWHHWAFGSDVYWEDSTNNKGFTMKYKIKPGQTLTGFSYMTNGLPIIADAYLRGYNYQWQGDYINNTSVDDYLNNSVIVKTIAAKLPPTPFVPLAFIDTLITYTDSSNALGWITNEQTRDKYDNYFNTAKTYLEQNNNNAAKSELQKVLTDCNADSSSVLTSEAYALLYFNTDYLIKQIPEGEPGLPVKLEDSQGNLLQGGSLQYYDRGWKDAIDNGDGTFTVQTEKSTVSLKMNYAGASKQLNNLTVGPDTTVFQTVNAKVQLKDSQGNLLPVPSGDGGTVKYYASGWKDFGTVENGEATKELLPKEYSFRMNYGGASLDKKQDISDNNPVLFSTVNCIVRVTDGSNQPIDNALASYYASDWKEIDNTLNGEINKELLPRNYSFRVNSNGVNKDKQQDISSNNIVEFTFE